MKVLFVIGNMSNGGAQRVASVLCNQFAQNGHNVSLLLFNRSEEEYSLSDKIQIYSLREDYQSYSSMSFAAVIVQMRKLIKRIDPDVAIGFTTGGYALYLASLGMNFPKIASARAAPHIIFGKKGLRARINRAWFRHADAVVLQTEGQIAETPTELLQNAVVIPNPIDLGSVEKNPVICVSQCERIIMAGRLEIEKNYPLAIAAMEMVIRSYPDARLTIYGKGSLHGELEAMIYEKNLQESVILAGWTADVRQKLLESDLFLLTSDFEGMPNALMEAMACGLPCISTDCRTGPSELIEDGVSGMLVPVGDAGALAETICHVMEHDAEWRKKLGCAAKSTIQDKYSVKKVVSQWEALFKELSTDAE